MLPHQRFLTFFAVFSSIIYSSASDDLALEVERPYDVVISLGPNCAAKSAIQQYLDKKTRDIEISEQDIKQLSPSCPFDWMTVCDYGALTRNLLNHFENFFSKETLELLDHPYAGKNYRSVHDKINRMLWNHLFSKPDSYITTQEIFESEYEEKSRKVLHLIDNFSSIKERRCLYVIVTRSIGELMAEQIVNALVTYRGNDNFTLLCFSEYNKEVNRKNLCVRKLRSVAFSDMDVVRFSEIIDTQFPLEIFTIH